MASTRKALPAQVDVAHLVSAGVLASVCPRSLVEEVLIETGRESQRERLLPAPAVVYYVMELALRREVPLEEVLRVVCEGLQWLGGGEAGAGQASKSAISQARTRLGAEVMHRLAERVLRPLAAPGAPGAWYRAMRVVALDGSGMDVADEAANAEYFGYPSAACGQSAFPQARLLGLVECGTHAVVVADIALGAQVTSPLANHRERQVPIAAARWPGLRLPRFHPRAMCATEGREKSRGWRFSSSVSSDFKALLAWTPEFRVRHQYARRDSCTALDSVKQRGRRVASSSNVTGGVDVVVTSFLHRRQSWWKAVDMWAHAVRRRPIVRMSHSLRVRSALPQRRAVSRFHHFDCCLAQFAEDQLLGAFGAPSPDASLQRS
jgi:hypothetical protein